MPASFQLDEAAVQGYAAFGLVQGYLVYRTEVDIAGGAVLFEFGGAGFYGNQHQVKV